MVRRVQNVTKVVTAMSSDGFLVLSVSGIWKISKSFHYSLVFNTGICKLMAAGMADFGVWFL